MLKHNCQEGEGAWLAGCVPLGGGLLPLQGILCPVGSSPGLPRDLCCASQPFTSEIQSLGKLEYRRGKKKCKQSRII